MEPQFTLSLLLNVSPDILFFAWLSSKEHSNFTGSPSKINPKVGGKFTAWDGYISGKTLELDQDKRIVQSWRTTEYPNGSPDSKIEITFEKVANGTKLVLRHYEIPEGQAEQYKQGWKDFYFTPMKEYYSS